ncbi:hypothetical protein CLAFUW4_14334 [Fulvia fulva]|uniref:uncharacterized protein n=1 Tax=Passalora fulva TaxID=5499 RepID=UPI002852CB21|nr:uncharacterized protein CLAFUR5_20377 [Fulvia fulva]KAK4608959.1 hypothetical protein CLAFUR4_14333 [Fulvia fulva]KAK4610002.1 hypothetical protein CLAFUR0_14337 [Fulvia fulva]WMI39092.1 hypothetical protein CLAFUR5_20377 [Fulvia fulva]WPV22530.1 hypothetical protein CLAFUW4_14334 [Fulvia fulva]WPV37759.1 hypothetical protein CLAFUW7_14341 [Fulvia fulva]
MDRFQPVHQTSYLLQLPRELRDMILELVVAQTDEVKLFIEHFERDSINEQIPPSLMHTCSQLRIEAAEIWYSKNTFRIHSIQQLLGLLDFEAEHHKHLRWVRLSNEATPYIAQAAKMAAIADQTCQLAKGTISVISSDNHPKPGGWVCFFVDARGRIETYENDRYYADLDEHYWAMQDES